MDDSVIGMIRILVLLPLLGFWMWMFWDMTRNQDISEEAKTQWAIAFVILNIFTAIYYYIQVYQHKK